MSDVAPAATGPLPPAVTDPARAASPAGQKIRGRTHRRRTRLLSPAEARSRLPLSPWRVSDDLGWRRGIAAECLRSPGPGELVRPPEWSHRLVLLPAASAGVTIRWSGGSKRAGGNADSTKRLVSAGGPDPRLCLIPAGRETRWLWPDELDCFTLALAPTLLAEAAKAEGLDPGGVELLGRQDCADAGLAWLAAAVRAELLAPSPRSPSFVASVAGSLCVGLVTGHARAMPQPPRPRRVPGRLSDAQLHRVHELMVKTGGGTPTVGDWAAAAGCSAGYFARAYAATTGEPPYAHFARLRVERAVALMRDKPGLKLIEVFGASGFSNPEHMSRQFRQVLNRTPGEVLRGLRRVAASAASAAARAATAGAQSLVPLLIAAAGLADWSDLLPA